ISVPNGFAKDWLESRYRSLISQTLARIVGYSVQAEFVIGSAPVEATDAPESHPLVAVGPAPTTASTQVRVEPTRVGGEGGTTNINPRYTFANFTLGSANPPAPPAR